MTDAFRYLTGFGGHFESEAIEGALPEGRNSPQQPAFGLYAEQLSGSAFTAPRHENRRSWLYRMRPTADHPPFAAYSGAPLFGALIIHANHFYPEFHARYLPRSTSFANRWLASFKLKRFGSKGPYCSSRWSMLPIPSSITSR